MTHLLAALLSWLHTNGTAQRAGKPYQPKVLPVSGSSEEGVVMVLVAGMSLIIVAVVFALSVGAVALAAAQPVGAAASRASAESLLRSVRRRAKTRRLTRHA
jgi:hypothetical protein